jgi:hypothetical protein
VLGFSAQNKMKLLSLTAVFFCAAHTALPQLVEVTARTTNQGEHFSLRTVAQDYFQSAPARFEQSLSEIDAVQFTFLAPENTMFRFRALPGARVTWIELTTSWMTGVTGPSELVLGNSGYVHFENLQGPRSLDFAFAEAFTTDGASLGASVSLEMPTEPGAVYTFSGVSIIWDLSQLRSLNLPVRTYTEDSAWLGSTTFLWSPTDEFPGHSLIVIPVPEPSAFGLLGCSTLLIGALLLKKRSNAK